MNGVKPSTKRGDGVAAMGAEAAEAQGSAGEAEVREAAGLTEEERFERRAQLRGALRVLLPGVYAWAVTVALPATHRQAPPGALWLGGLSLVCLIAGPFLANQRPVWGKILGIYGFLAGALLTWLVLGDSIGRMDPLRAALGSVGWALFAFGWGAVRQVGQVPEQQPNVLLGAPLKARGQLPWGATWLLGIGLAGAVLLVFLAWRVERPVHALLAQAIAVVAGIALVSAATSLAISRGAREADAPLVRFKMGSRPLGFALLLCVSGLLIRQIW